MTELVKRLVRQDISVLIHRDGRLDEQATVSPGLAVLPGAFNPLHAGHQEMADTASRRLGRTVTFELSVSNVDKQKIAAPSVVERLGQFDSRDSVWITHAARFQDKAALFPAATFIVGADTILRVADLRFYQFDAARRQRCFQQIEERGCRFLVFGRLLAGRFCSLTNLTLPASLRALCDEIPPTVFRRDISSTALREGD